VIVLTTLADRGNSTKIKTRIGTTMGPTKIGTRIETKMGTGTDTNIGIHDVTVPRTSPYSPS